MKVTITDSQFRGEQGAQFGRQLAAGARRAPNGEIADIDSEIATLQRAAGMTADEARRRLEAGEVDETTTLIRLLMLTRRRSLLFGPR
jgi:hypothetical protein